MINGRDNEIYSSSASLTQFNSLIFSILSFPDANAKGLAWLTVSTVITYWKIKSCFADNEKPSSDFGKLFVLFGFLAHISLLSV